MSFASTSYDLNCQNHEIDIYTNPAGEFNLETTLTVNGPNDYFIEGGYVKFLVNEYFDQYANIIKVNNSLDYRPRVYKNHAKFGNIGKDIFGAIDFVVPHATLLEAPEKFQGTFILSHIEDHWGGTITAQCSLTPKDQEQATFI